MQVSSTLVLQVLALATSALALPTQGQTQTRTVADIQVFQCAPNNNGTPLFGTCCKEFRENGSCADSNLATKSFADPSGFTQFSCGDTERNEGTPTCCKTIRLSGSVGIPDSAREICSVDTVLF